MASIFQIDISRNTKCALKDIVFANPVTYILLSFSNVDVFPWPRTKENFRLYPMSTVWRGIGDDCEG